MKTKKHLLIGGFLGAIFIFLFSVNFVFAQSCGDPYGAGNCEFSPCPSGTHQIADSYPSPICGGEWVCCAANPSGGLPISETSTTPFDECIAQGGDYDDCKDRQGAPAGTSVPTGSFGLPPASLGTVGGGWSLGSISTFGLPGGSIMAIVVNILLWILRIFGVLGILGFLISGIIYLTAAGDEDRMAYAKRAMQYSIIGVIVGLVGFVIIQAVDYALNTYSSF